MLDGQVIIVTGGSKGLGFAAAQALVEQGAQVAIFARDKQAIEQAVAQLGQDKALGLALDITQPSAVIEAFKQVKQHFGTITGLVNNAGVARPNLIETLPAEDLKLQIDTNFCALVYCCQSAIAYLRENGGGRIINVSSASVHHDNEMSHLSIYAASKAAVEVFSRELRYEVAKDNIMVSVVVPGSAQSEFAAGFDMNKLRLALHAWQEKGPNFDGTMQAHDVGKAIAHCFAYPQGVSVDFIEIKPHQISKKPIF